MNTARTIVLGVLLAGLYVLTHGYHTGKYEESFYLPIVYHLINPELLKSDWFINLPPYHGIILGALAKIGRVVSVPGAFAILYFLSLAAFWTILLHWVRRCSSSGAIAILMGLFWIPVAGWGGYPLIQDYYVPNLSAMVLVLGAISLWFSPNWLWVPLLLVGTAWIHLLVGVNAGVWFALGFVRRFFDQKRISIRWFVYISSAASILVIPVVANHLGEILLSRGSHFYDVNVVLRYPHHYWLRWSGSGGIALLIGMMAGVGALIRRLSNPDIRRLWWHLWMGLWVMLAIQIIGGDLLKVPWVFQLQLLRITYWIPVFYIVLLAIQYHDHPVFVGIWLAMPAVFVFEVTFPKAMILLVMTHATMSIVDRLHIPFQRISDRLWQRLLIVYGFWLLGLMGIRGIPVDLGLEYLYKDSWGQMCRWIEKNTPSQSSFVAPPDQETFRLLTHRATIVDFRACPYRESDVQNWILRMNDLSGMDLRSLKQQGFNLLDDIREGYLRLPSQSVVDLGDRYGSDHFLTSTPRPEFRLLHQVGDWRLYRLRD